jgi:protoporphyrinogen oxidase
MSPEKIKIIILGAGPAGLMLAFKLLQRRDINIDLTVIERDRHPGGIAASFQEEDIWLDFGSHRLHPSTPDYILDDIRAIVGTSLLKRTRNGRIRLLGRYLKFPLKPVDCLLHLPFFSFSLRILFDLIQNLFRDVSPSTTFGASLLNGLGPTVCNTFYFPYARKLWGIPPDQIDVEQARKRVSAGSISKILKKMAAFLPGLRTENTGIFYYPEEGIGQISEKLAQKVTRLGGNILYETNACSVTMKKQKITSVTVQTRGREREEFPADFTFSTIPVTRIIDMLSTRKSQAVLQAAHSLKYRNMVFFYLVMDCDQWQPYDAHYFPEEDFIFSRISEGKNYYGGSHPAGKTIICCEIPCNPDDEIWTGGDDYLQRLVLEDMKKADIPANQLVRVFSKRKTNVYPVYTVGYPRQLEILEKHLAEVEGLITLGRQGLFTHDNIHHTMMMADRAAQCIDPSGEWDATRWVEFMQEFSGYVVED